MTLNSLKMATTQKLRTRATHIKSEPVRSAICFLFYNFFFHFLLFGWSTNRVERTSANSAFCRMIAGAVTGRLTIPSWRLTIIEELLFYFAPKPDISGGGLCVKLKKFSQAGGIENPVFRSTKLIIRYFWPSIYI